MCFRKLLSSMFGKDKDAPETEESVGNVIVPDAEGLREDESLATEVEMEIERTAKENPQDPTQDDVHQEMSKPNGEKADAEDTSSSKTVEPDPEAVDEPDSVEQVIPKEDKPVEIVPVPNPMREVEYAHSVEEWIGQKEILSVTVSDEIGDLGFDMESKSLKGKPTASRDFWIEIELPEKVLRLKCFVNENPRMLWQDIPSDQMVKPDKDYKAILSPEVDIVAASHRGRSHANRGSYRDDDFFIGQVGRFNLSIVADGAGSAPLSSTGSKVFCQLAGMRFSELVNTKYDELIVMLEDLQHHPGDALKDQKFLACMYEILPTAAFYGRGLLTKLASERQVPLKQFHTTALLSLSIKIEDGSYFCAAFQIGDGMTAALADQQLVLLGLADAGNFPGETIFVTSNGVFDDPKALLRRINCFFCKTKPTIVSMTDGITDSYFKENPSLNDIAVWQRMLDEVKNEEGSLKPGEVICDWLNYYVDQEHDDRTLSIIMYK